MDANRTEVKVVPSTEEEEYDAFNNETFGDTLDGAGDWEKNDEVLSQTLEVESPSANEVTDGIENIVNATLSQLGLDDDIKISEDISARVRNAYQPRRFSEDGTSMGRSAMDSGFGSYVDRSFSRRPSAAPSVQFPHHMRYNPQYREDMDRSAHSIGYGGPMVYGGLTDEENQRYPPRYLDQMRRSKNSNGMCPNQSPHPGGVERRNSVGTPVKEYPAPRDYSTPRYPRMNGTSRGENFDTRNVETFGFDAVQQHVQGAGVQRPTSHQATNRAFPSRYEEPDPYVGSLGRRERDTLVKMHDPRMQELYYSEIMRRHRQGLLMPTNPMETVYPLHPFERMQYHPPPFENRSVPTGHSMRKMSDIGCGLGRAEEARGVPPMELYQERINSMNVGATVGLMDDLLEKLTDTDHPLSEDDQLHVARQLTNVIRPSDVHSVVRYMIARNLLMRSLATLWKLKPFRIYCLDVLCEMFVNLHHLLVVDRDDMVFGAKSHIFAKIISTCTMDQVCQLTKALLGATDLAIESKLGLVLIGKLIETADGLDYKSSDNWLNGFLPALTEHILKVKMVDIVEGIVGKIALEHIARNSITHCAMKPIGSSKLNFKA